MARFIESLHVRDFRCCKDVRFELTDLHAFVGPNDSGKSTLLEAIQKASTPMRGNLPEDWVLTAHGAEIRRGPGGTVVTRGGQVITTPPAELTVWAGYEAPIVRLDPDQLREPADLIVDDVRAAWFATNRGRGLPGVYDLLLAQARPAFDDLEAECRALYPTVAGLLLTNAGAGKKALGIRLVDGTMVAAAEMSEGMLFYLAYSAMQYLRPTPLLLIEEPETGLHPSRIADVVRVLRQIAKTRQVVLATHSPLVVNELTPDEVSVVTRDPITGTRVTRLKDTPNFEQRASVYALGELWLAYANGTDEAPLLRPVAGESAP